MVFNVTFNHISVISWRSVLLVEKTGVPGENHQNQNSFSATLGIRIFFINKKQSDNPVQVIRGLSECP